ncbi:hypothetical protein K9M41_00435 [Candidatus Gracilibacteria bacterium]|nr:hypothetical protein [Candidatus Gracilibacteria bacterium]
MKKESTNQNFDPGKIVFEWEALDYHPHKRGWLWITIFCLIFFGSAIWALFYGDWVMALTLFIAVAVYFYIHRNGDEEHQITVFEKGIFIDRRFFPKEAFSGFWFVYDESVAVVNLQLSNTKNDKKITLQMGKNDPEFFRNNFSKVGLLELEDKKEGLVDLWMRALKL